MIGYYLYNYAPHIIVIGVALLIFYFSFRKRVQQKERLKKIAMRFGFEFSDQIVDLNEPDYGLTDVASKSTATTGPEETNRLTDMVRVVSGWRMEGRFNGVQIRIYSTRGRRGSERSSTESTRMSAFGRWQSNSSLMVTRETTLSRLGKAVLNMQDIQTSNEELNRKVVIKGVPENFVKRIVDDAGLQRELLQLFELDGMIYVDQHGAHYQKQGTLLDEELYRKVLEQLTRTASALERASAA